MPFHTAPDALLDTRIDYRYKGIPPAAGELALREIGERGWNVLREDLLLPVLTLRESAVRHNIALMAAFCAEHGVDLAPHGKTPMAPQLALEQLAAGAWGITAATPTQAAIFADAGVRRIVLANQVVDGAGLRWIRERPDVELFCLVDSVEGVERLDGDRPLDVLLELGAPGTRAGCRDEASALAVAEAVTRSRSLRLAGVEAFEGVVMDRTPENEAAVDALLERLESTLALLERRGHLAGGDEVLLSAGGSVWMDRVAALAGHPGYGLPRRVVLRSGCYLTHDHGLYEHASPLTGLQQALELWAVVLSRPEPGLAIVGFGRRDCSYDSGLPVPLWRRTGDDVREIGPGEMTVKALGDQHAFVDCAEPGPAVGDLLGFGLSHPCTVFDKWRLVFSIDDSHTVTGGVLTFF
jgi:D-serine deaminase-like pyridoxal phosphate-dependent protein